MDNEYIDNDLIDDNKKIIELKEEYNNFNDNEEDKDFKTRKELIYDLIQDNYINIKNSLLILRKRLINNQNILVPLNEAEVRNFLNIKNVNNIKDLKVKKKINKKKHSKFFCDNIFYKIKVLYHKFIVSLANDIYNNCNSIISNKNYFRRISAQITQNCTKEFNKNLADLTLKEFLSKSISSRYLNTSENANRENTEKIEFIYKTKEKFQTLITFLKYSYKNLYNNFYIKDNCEELVEENFNIKNRTYITFKESIKKLSDKQSKEYINKLIEVANDEFILFLEGKRIKHKNMA